MGRNATTAGASRREMPGAAAAAAGLSALPAWALAAASGRQVAGFEPALVPSVETLGGWLKHLHAFGPIRATGTPQARVFEEFLATQFGALGFTIQRDHLRLTGSPGSATWRQSARSPSPRTARSPASLRSSPITPSPPRRGAASR